MLLGILKVVVVVVYDDDEERTVPKRDVLYLI